MSNPPGLLLNAEFSLSAYANLEDGTLGNADQRTALQDAGMSEEQAQRFSLNYSVVTQFNDTETGFSTTVFKDDDNNLTLAFRGTEQFTEDLLFTDSLIAFNGVGYNQVVAMYNWWQRASAPAGTMVDQFQLATRPVIGGNPPEGAIPLYTTLNGSSLVYLETASQSEASGELVGALAADPDGAFDLTGHSLGGHLALAFNTFGEKGTDLFLVELATGKTRWQARERPAPSTGILATAGNLIFAGFLDRSFAAYDQTTGERLWKRVLTDVPSAAPITYAIDGKQYVAVVVGYGSHWSVTEAILTPEITLPVSRSSSLWVFSLPNAE